MDVAALSTILSQTNVRQQASLFVMEMAMDTAEQNGQNMADMLKGSQPNVSLESHLGKNVDLKG